MTQTLIIVMLCVNAFTWRSWNPPQECAGSMIRNGLSKVLKKNPWLPPFLIWRQIKNQCSLGIIVDKAHNFETYRINNIINHCHLLRLEVFNINNCEHEVVLLSPKNKLAYHSHVFPAFAKILFFHSSKLSLGLSSSSASSSVLMEVICDSKNNDGVNCRKEN